MKTLIVLGVVLCGLFALGVTVVPLVPELHLSIGTRGVLSRWCLSLSCAIW